MVKKVLQTICIGFKIKLKLDSATTQEQTFYNARGLMCTNPVCFWTCDQCYGWKL